MVNIVTCYRVSQDSGASIGESTAFIQQETILRKAKITESPLEHCIKELIRFITKATLAGEEVILSMDANEPMHGPRNSVQKLLSATGMVDAIAKFHGDEAPKTYLRGKNRIDYMFVTPGIIPYLCRSGNLGIQDCIPSDHVGFWLEFDGTELFRGATENLGTIQQKPFTMRNTEQLKTFIEKMETYLTSKRVEQRLEAFQKGLSEGNLASRTEVEEYERIARDVDDAIRCGIKAT